MVHMGVQRARSWQSLLGRIGGNFSTIFEASEYPSGRSHGQQVESGDLVAVLLRGSTYRRPVCSAVCLSMWIPKLYVGRSQAFDEQQI